MLVNRHHLFYSSLASDVPIGTLNLSLRVIILNLIKMLI